MKKYITAIAMFVASSAASAVNCDWREPGSNPFSGAKAEAIARFTEVPTSERAAMFVRSFGKPNAVVAITKTGIESMFVHPITDVRDMAFGKVGRCPFISRASWADDHVEVADAWCGERYCIARARVCGNWFWFEHLTSAARLRGPSTVVGKMPEPGSAALVSIALIAVVALRNRRGSGCATQKNSPDVTG